MKDCLAIRMTSGGAHTGHLDTETFCRAIDAPRSMFLADTIRRFNERKESSGEPERAEIVIAPHLERKPTR